MTDKMPFEIVKTTLGMLSIKDLSTGEIMHNPVGPWQESRALYVGQSGLKKRLTTYTQLPLILFDVGLGAGFNALAAILEFHDAVSPRPLHIISFEKDLRLFEFSANNIDQFPEFAKYQTLMNELISNGKIVHDSGLTWEIRHGSFVDMIKTENQIPEIIFFDPYSPKVNAEMWSLTLFEDVFKLAKQSSFPSILMTYSIATGIRTGLMLAGYYVGSGQGSGLKEETTFASTEFLEIQSPFSDRWLERWKRSLNPLPPGYPSSREEALEKLLDHPQWTLAF